MSGSGNNLMDQLSGLRLMDGTVVGSRAQSGTTPPTLSSLSGRPARSAGSPNSFPSSSSAAPVGASTTMSTPPAAAGSAKHASERRRGHRETHAEKTATSATATAATTTTPPAGSVSDKITRLLQQNQGSLKANTTTNSTSSSPKPASAVVSAPATSALNNTKSTPDDGSSIISSLAAHIQKSSSPPPASGNAVGVTTFSSASTPTRATQTPPATGSGATKSGMPVPKPRSAETTNSTSTSTSITAATSEEVLNPKVVEFFQTVAGASLSPPPIAEPRAGLKVAVALSGANVAGRAAASAAVATTATGKHNQTSSNPQTGAASSPPTAASGKPASSSPRGSGAGQVSLPGLLPTSSAAAAETAYAANRFLAKAFGSIDNVDAVKPIICTAPSIDADGRYIIVGDVHGCIDQLEQLVEKSKYVQGKDCLFIIGDYVNKGPDSTAVVQACQRLGAYGVLGNHDYTLLKCCARMRRRPFTPDDLRDPVKRLAQKFPKDCEHYLRGLPHMVRIPRHNVLLVHAGLNVEHSLENQNVEDVMHLRRLEAVVKRPGGYRAIAKGMEGVPWGTLWPGPETVVFGHDAYAGFQSHPHACGIDTGCVYGDPLTCVIFGPDSPEGEFLSVPGQPKLVNEARGLPPPNADIYEQHELEQLEKLMIRPTSRATPALNASMGSKPVFLAAPLGYTEGSPDVTAASGAAAVTAPTMKTSQLTATVTSTNAVVATPTSAFPSGLSTPTCPANLRMLETTTASTREMQRATLLALSATRELTAIAVLLGMPLYSAEMDAMIEAEASDAMAQQAFWVPISRLVLVAAAASSKEDKERLASAEPSVQLVLDVCDEMSAVRETLQEELKAFLASEKTQPGWPKRVVKFAETLVD